MININMISKGVMNNSSIQSINIVDPISVKNQSNIKTIIKQPNQQSVRPIQQHPVSPVSQQLVSPISQQPAIQSHVSLPVPVLQNCVQKGQKAALSSTPINAVTACFGWDTTDARCDLDVSAFMLGADGKVIGDSWFVFYGQIQSPDNSIKFNIDGKEYHEKISVDFNYLDPRVKKIVFVLTIDEALENNLNFGMVKDAYVRIMDNSSGNELVSFMMTDYYSNVISMMIGELYQHNGTWKFNAVGNGVAKDLEGLCELYGVEVM